MNWEKKKNRLVCDNCTIVFAKDGTELWKLIIKDKETIRFHSVESAMFYAENLFGEKTSNYKWIFFVFVIFVVYFVIYIF
jgi:hypothetical protein